MLGCLLYASYIMGFKKPTVGRFRLTSWSLINVTMPASVGVEALVPPMLRTLQEEEELLVQAVVTGKLCPTNEISGYALLEIL